MLPSGNDAAIIISDSLGAFLELIEDKYLTAKELIYDHKNFRKKIKDIQYPEQWFVQEMNRNATNLGLASTNYANVHGL